MKVESYPLLTFSPFYLEKKHRHEVNRSDAIPLTYYKCVAAHEVVRIVQIAVRIALMITLQFFLACGVIIVAPLCPSGTSPPKGESPLPRGICLVVSD